MTTLTDDERATATEVTYLPRGYGDDFGMSEEELDWKSFLDEMGDAIQYAKIIVYRVPTYADGKPAKRQMAFLFECGLDEYTYSQLCTRIQTEFGSGLYRIQARDKGGALRKNKTIAIEAPKANEVERSGNSAGDVIDRMSRAMQEQQDRFEQMIERITGRAVDPLDQMTRMAGAMAAMMEAMGVKNSVAAQPPKTLIEQLTELKLMKELIGEISGDDHGTPDTFWGAITETVKTLGGPIMLAISQAQQSGQLNADGVLQRHLPNPKKPEKENQAMRLNDVRPQLEFLLKQAKAQVPEADVVAFIMNALPDDGEAHESLEDFLKRETCIDECIGVLPEIANYRDWFMRWRTAMLDELALFFEDDVIDPAGDDAPEGDDLTGEGQDGDTPGSEAGEALGMGNGAVSGQPADSPRDTPRDT